ncbi:hypothetical protein V866_000502 [Kwoniella sp. B9012]
MSSRTRPSGTPSSSANRSRSPSPGHRGYYLCSLCNRGFKKHEHLQRHEKTHTASKPFQCTQCDRKFSRQDSLLRHVRLTHREKSAPTPDSADTQPTIPQTVLSKPSPLFNPGTSVSSDPTISDRDASRTTGISMWSNDIVTSDSMLRTTIPRDEIGTSLDYTDYLATVPISASIGPDPGQLENRLAPLAMSSQSYSPVAFPPAGGEDIWQLLTQDVLPDSYSLHTSPRFLAELGLNSDSLFQSATAPLDDGQSRNEDSYGQTNTHLYLDRSSFEGPSLSSSGVDAEERGAYVLSATSTMIARMSSGYPSEVTPLSSETLALCLNMFWTRVWPTSPILHPSTFNMKQTSAPLLINMIALGCLASQKPSLRVKGNSLWALVNRSIHTSWSQLIENKGPYDPCKGVQLIQTLACGLLYAWMSASPNIINAAGLSVANGIRWTYLAGMNDPEVLTQSFLPGKNEQLTPPELDIRWRQWATMEDLKRSLCIIYQADCILARMSDVPPTVRPLSISFGGLWDDEATYLASNAISWQRAVQACTSQIPSMHDVPISHIYQYFFKGDIAQDRELSLLPMMIRYTIIEGLTSLIIDPIQPHFVPEFGIANLTSIDHALARYYTVFLHRTTDPRSRSVLVGRWHEAAITLGYALAKQHGLSDQQLWQSSIGRHLLLHANAIRQNLETFLIGKAKIPSPSLPQVIYTAALVFKEYLASTPGHAVQNPATFYSLNLDIDWERINRSLGTCCTQDLTAPIAQTNPSSCTAEDFIKHAATPLLHGIRISIHDIDTFLTVLTALGRTFPRAEELLMKLSDRYM